MFPNDLTQPGSINTGPEPPSESRDMQVLREEIHRLRGFNRDVAHEMVSCVASMNHLAALGELALQRGDPARLETFLALMRQEAASATVLVDSLKALSEEQLPLPSCRPVSLAECVARAQRNLILGGRHEATASTPVVMGKLPQVWGNDVLLVQLFVNLIGNALKFSRRNPNGRVEVYAQQHGDQTVAICVQDNGEGFDEHQGRGLFEPFHRGHGAGHPGHGLGLSVVRSIAQRHGGRVWAESEPGCGARFLVSLPVCSGLDAAEAGTGGGDEFDDPAQLAAWGHAFVASPEQVRDAVQRVGTDVQAMGRYLLGLRPTPPQ
jgi:signal transduction histidine kinase